MENSINLIGAITSLFIGVVGVTIGWMLNKYKDSVKYALELHKEYNSTEMSKYRDDGWKIISENLYTPIKEIYARFGNESLGILMVLRF